MSRKVGILNQVDKSPTPERVYGRWFLSAYVSNTTLMLAVSLMFRYSDFVASIGGNAADLGWITGLGTAGALCVRVIHERHVKSTGVASVGFGGGSARSIHCGGLSRNT